MGFRSMPYTEVEGKPQFAGMGSGGGSGGGGGSYSLPTATASRLGGVKIGNGVSVSGDGTISVQSSGYSYSTTPYDTGKKWIDGRTVFGKVFLLDSTTGSSIDVSSLNIDIYWCYGQVKFTASGNKWAIPYYYDSNDRKNIYIDVNEKLNIETALSSNEEVVLLVEYVEKAQ